MNGWRESRKGHQARQGAPEFSCSTDNLRSDAYRGLCPEELIDIMTMNRLFTGTLEALDREAAR